jgi:uncharacterized damage-inducible protein DinB
MSKPFRKSAGNEQARIKQALQEYLNKLAALRKEHDELLREFIKALEKAKEEELRSTLEATKRD